MRAVMSFMGLAGDNCHLHWAVTLGNQELLTVIWSPESPRTLEGDNGQVLRTFTCLGHSCVSLGLSHILNFWIIVSFLFQGAKVSSNSMQGSTVVHCIRRVPLSLLIGTVWRWKRCQGIQILTKDIPDRVWVWRMMSIIPHTSGWDWRSDCHKKELLEWILTFSLVFPHPKGSFSFFGPNPEWTKIVHRSIFNSGLHNPRLSSFSDLSLGYEIKVLLSQLNGTEWPAGTSSLLVVLSVVKKIF